MELAAWEVIVLIVAGFAAGLVNVMAGGGSILTVPIMMFLGILLLVWICQCLPAFPRPPMSQP